MEVYSASSSCSITSPQIEQTMGGFRDNDGNSSDTFMNVACTTGDVPDTNDAVADTPDISIGVANTTGRFADIFEGVVDASQLPPTVLGVSSALTMVPEVLPTLDDSFRTVADTFDAVADRRVGDKCRRQHRIRRQVSRMSLMDSESVADRSGTIAGSVQTRNPPKGAGEGGGIQIL